MVFVSIPGGSYLMGDDTHNGFIEDYEGPAVVRTVESFEMMTTPVTNREFQVFVAKTNYHTLAERLGNSYVFHLLVEEELRETYPHVAGAPWWLVVEGANWQHPFGPLSSLEGMEDHPVTHVAFEDAIAYCKWAGYRLPTEVQWEYAARGGTTTVFPWGDKLEEDGEFHANTWQGEFPRENQALDGFIGTAPVESYHPNSFGLYQMIGNVWEWCANERGVVLPLVPEKASLEDAQLLEGEVAIRGGSFLCHCSYCNRYRVAARNGAMKDSTTSHVGFRCIRVKE